MSRVNVIRLVTIAWCCINLTVAFTHKICFRNLAEDQGVMGSVLPNNRMNVKSIWFAPTLPETIILYIDETGIKSFQWGDPLTIVESTIEKTKMLPINKVFAKIIRYFRSNYNWDCVVSTQDVPLIEKIVLTDAVIISSPFSRNDGKVKPAWAVFYSTEREKENYSPPSIIFIDAENGIVLNPFILNEE